MRLIGPIVRLQVQEASLKVGEPRRQRYEPAALRSVPALTLSEAGVRGWTETGEPVDDVHHRDHPASKNRGGSNGVSICFTAHYDAIRQRFGEHLHDGLAGENILIATDQWLSEDDLGEGIIIETAHGPIRLSEIIVATPCVEFTRYAMRYPEDARPDRTVAEALRFLDAGTRGYYATYRGPDARVRIGDRAVVLGQRGRSISSGADRLPS